MIYKCKAEITIYLFVLVRLGTVPRTEMDGNRRIKEKRNIKGD